MELRFFPINIFRETPKVTFFDAGIDSSNGSDVVIHSGEAISPPDDLKDEQYYVPRQWHTNRAGYPRPIIRV